MFNSDFYEGSFKIARKQKKQTSGFTAAIMSHECVPRKSSAMLPQECSEVKCGVSTLDLIIHFSGTDAAKAGKVDIDIDSDTDGSAKTWSLESSVVTTCRCVE